MNRGAVYYEQEPGRRAAANLLTRDEPRCIAANIANFRNCGERRKEKKPAVKRGLNGGLEGLGGKGNGPPSADQLPEQQSGSRKSAECETFPPSHGARSALRCPFPTGMR
jgi:hypothetical protein